MEPAESLHVILGWGPVGRALGDALYARGRSVRVVTRSGRAAVPDSFEVVAADVSDPEHAARACRGAGIVYGCVGMDYRRWPEKWPPLMKGMLHGAEVVGARFVFLDNCYMYGPVDRPMTEDMSLTNYGRKPSTRATITRLWREAHAAGRVPAASVRASDFYGPGVEQAVLGAYTFGRLVQGKPAQCFGNVDLPHSFTYVPDIARALVDVGEAGDEVAGQAWNVPNAPDRTVRDHLRMFCDRSGCELKVQVAPRILLTVFGLFDENMREMKEMLYQWERPFLVDHSKFAARFWSDATPFEAGIAATAEAFAARHRRARKLDHMERPTVPPENAISRRATLVAVM